jgi:predicted membrane protein
MRRAQAVTGLVLVVIGFASFLERLGDGESFFTLLGIWWPLAIIAFGLWRLIRLAERAWADAGLLALILIGLALLGYTTGYIDRRLHGFTLPLVLMSVGLWIVLLGSRGRNAVVQDGIIRRVTFFENTHVEVRDEFRFANLTAFFSDMLVDLRNATVSAHHAKLHVNILFGRIQVVVPPDVEVQIQGFPLARTGVGHSTHENQSSSYFLDISKISVIGELRVWTDSGH